MNILNLSGFDIIQIAENQYDYQIKVGTTTPPSFCPHCGCVSNLYKHSLREQVCMDLPMHGKRVGILNRRTRYKCRCCNRTFWERLPHIDEKRGCTKRLVEYIEEQSLSRTFVSLSDEIGLDEKTIRNIFRDYVNRLERSVRFETPEWLGIDEIHLTKPRCVVTNIKERTIIDILMDRNKQTVINYLINFPDRDKIRYVTMDMWQPYRDAVRSALPSAQIIIDKFHVVRMANQALEIVRKDIRSGLSPKVRTKNINARPFYSSKTAVRIGFQRGVNS